MPADNRSTNKTPRKNTNTEVRIVPENNNDLRQSVTINGHPALLAGLEHTIDLLVKGRKIQPMSRLAAGQKVDTIVLKRQLLCWTDSTIMILLF